ncbi:MAG: hypothetical protein KatS3mg119_0494 [Rhodothalassiaceae bacterium]|nr:MAG: hypothetical protein KatS3mg119_0494 [Rhodothalassiaceae bacterium]
MHILYLDGAGGAANPKDRHFVLAGVSVFERGMYHLIKKLDDFVDGLDLGPGSEIELHASHIYAGKSLPWRRMKDRRAREQVLRDALGLLVPENRSVHPFAAALPRTGRRSPSSRPPHAKSSGLFLPGMHVPQAEDRVRTAARRHGI